MIPPAKRGGRRREVNVREVLNAVFYVLSTGCQWQALPKDLPPKSTAHYYFMLWDWEWHAGAPPSHALCRDTRAGRAGGEPDGRDHRQPECQGRSKRGSTLDPQGFDAGKKVTGRKRHILVDTLGLLLNVVVHPANVQDRDGARLVLDRRTRRLFPFIERIFADAGYQGAKTAAAIAKTGSWKLEIVKRNEPHRFVVLPKRWIVERTLAWISHNRRLARDFERYARSVAAFVRLAMIRIMLKRLTRSAHCS
jgi:transposase